MQIYPGTVVHIKNHPGFNHRIGLLKTAAAQQIWKWSGSLSTMTLKRGDTAMDRVVMKKSAAIPSCPEQKWTLLLAPMIRS